MLQLICSLVLFPLWGQSPQEKWQEADNNYQQGEQTTSYQERKLAFNKALFLLHDLVRKDFSSFNLDQALGDTYFQLGEYAWATLYYQRALKQNGHNVLLSAHLKQAQDKLSIPWIENQQLHLLTSLLALFRQTFFLWGAIALTFLAFSCAIWLPLSWVRRIAMSCAILTSLLFSNALIFYYSTPLEGILIQSTGFYRAPDQSQPQLTIDPLFSGSKVQILHMTQDGEWLKIKEKRRIGYIPTHTLRLI